jgi:DNA processing protein
LTPRTLSERERIDWLRLARTETVGAVTFSHLIARYGSASEALREAPGLARRGGRPATIDIPSATAAEAELAAGARLGARLIATCEADYPRLLAVLDAPPPLIWTLGDAAMTNRKSVAIVGARAASAAGQRFARGLAAALGEAGYAVVSGMARGIDTAAHEGSLASGTIAVLAGGVDDIYPAENAGLYDALRSRGCVVSERPVGHSARAADFPRRNRLISGLALGVVVVEAEVRSGSLITARLAGEQGRDVFAVPGSPLDPRARGANDLIRQGATLVEEVEDILRVIGGRGAVHAPDPSAWPAAEPASDADTELVRSIIEGLLSPAPMSIDELARASRSPITDVLAALTELAVAGRAELLAGGLAVLVPDRSR